jgi:polysaccharide pyruvyl transferase WcaK-like protein
MTAGSGSSRAIQIANGLGAGNIGDDLMACAFWDAVPAHLDLDVEVFPNVDLVREAYPSRFRYRRIDWTGLPVLEPDVPGLLVGDTPVTDVLGGWPLTFLAPRLQAFHDAGQPVDALGIGVEPLRLPESRALFSAHYSQIRSWTVRSAACRDELIGLGIAPQKIRVGADWAWLYKARRDLADWGASTWRGLGIDPDAPLLVANVVNEAWEGRAEPKAAVAWALDELHERHGLQIAFLCHEMREGPFFDKAAAVATEARMRSSAVIVPNLYYSPDETLGLLAHADVTLAARYHFGIASVLAGSLPAIVVRSAKMQQLVDELGLPSCGALDTLSGEALAERVLSLLRAEAPLRAALAESRARLAERAAGNAAQALAWQP